MLTSLSELRSHEEPLICETLLFCVSHVPRKVCPKAVIRKLAMLSVVAAKLDSILFPEIYAQLTMAQRVDFVRAFDSW